MQRRTQGLLPLLRHTVGGDPAAAVERNNACLWQLQHAQGAERWRLRHGLLLLQPARAPRSQFERLWPRCAERDQRFHRVGGGHVHGERQLHERRHVHRARRPLARALPARRHLLGPRSYLRPHIQLTHRCHLCSRALDQRPRAAPLWQRHLRHRLRGHLRRSLEARHGHRPGQARRTPPGGRLDAHRCLLRRRRFPRDHRLHGLRRRRHPHLRLAAQPRPRPRTYTR
mmetsp:Transcript_45715/g.97460  ORF Transcript_45715/g.97460 Transcript_45715/m.97460 type:complete len:228 (+) Transcript_45715:311-994(+)